MNRGGIKSINKALFAIKKRAEVNKEIRNNKQNYAGLLKQKQVQGQEKETWNNNEKKITKKSKKE